MRIAKQVCSIECCDRPAYGKGFCEGHRARWRHGKRGNDLESPLRWHRPAEKKPHCIVPNCDQAVHCKDMCTAHYQRSKSGKALDVPIRVSRPPDPNRTEKDRKLWYRSGITESEWDMLLSLQNERCALCETTRPNINKAWHLDHDHSCKNHVSYKYGADCVRGLLCGACNTELGVIEKWAAYGRLQVGDDLKTYLLQRPVLELRGGEFHASVDVEGNALIG